MSTKSTDDGLLTENEMLEKYGYTRETFAESFSKSVQRHRGIAGGDGTTQPVEAVKVVPIPGSITAPYYHFEQLDDGTKCLVLSGGPSVIHFPIDTEQKCIWRDVSECEITPGINDITIVGKQIQITCGTLTFENSTGGNIFISGNIVGAVNGHLLVNGKEML
jgi:hypothetical protein